MILMIIFFFFFHSGDVVLSYIYILEKDNLKTGIAAIIAACFWLLCALIYLGVICVDLYKYKLRTIAGEGKNEESEKAFE
jgi:hypothetical protein